MRVQVKDVRFRNKIVDAIYNVFTELNISIENFVSIQMDSGSAMREVRFRVLSRLPNLVLRLVDTGGGDTPHTVH